MGYYADELHAEFSKGYDEGYADGMDFMKRSLMPEITALQNNLRGMSGPMGIPMGQRKGPQRRFKGRDSIIKQKRKVKQTPKQKLLTQMAKKKWNKYKKGRGKKTYVEIRAEVSRSQLYKRKAKRL